MRLDTPTIFTLDAPATHDHPEARALEAEGFNPVWLKLGGDVAPTECIERADVILSWSTPVDGDLIRRARKCMLIARYGPGNVPESGTIDLEAARRADIYVASTPDFAPQAWAEIAMRLIAAGCQCLGFHRKLHGMRLGLLGLGSVGRAIAHRADPLGVELWGFDPFSRPHVYKDLNIRWAPLEHLAGLAQVLLVLTPLAPATRGIIGRRMLAHMQHRSLLVNMGRPELVDLAALAEALARGRPARAAFVEDPRACLARTTITPALNRDLVDVPRHSPWADPGVARAMRRAMGRLLLHFCRGGRPDHLLIDPPAPRHVMGFVHQRDIPPPGM